MLAGEIVLPAQQVPDRFADQRFALDEGVGHQRELPVVDALGLVPVVEAMALAVGGHVVEDAEAADLRAEDEVARLGQLQGELVVVVVALADARLDVAVAVNGDDGRARSSSTLSGISR